MDRKILIFSRSHQGTRITPGSVQWPSIILGFTLKLSAFKTPFYFYGSIFGGLSINVYIERNVKKLHNITRKNITTPVQFQEPCMFSWIPLIVTPKPKSKLEQGNSDHLKRNSDLWTSDILSLEQGKKSKDQMLLLLHSTFFIPQSSTFCFFLIFYWGSHRSSLCSQSERCQWIRLLWVTVKIQKHDESWRIHFEVHMKI